MTSDKTISEIIGDRKQLEYTIQVLIDEFESNCLIKVTALEIERSSIHDVYGIDVKLDFFNSEEEMMLGIKGHSK